MSIQLDVEIITCFKCLISTESIYIEYVLMLGFDEFFLIFVEF